MSKISETDRREALAIARAHLESMTDEEDAALTAAAVSDPDSGFMTEEERARSPRRRGRPPLARPKVETHIRLDADVVDALKASGPGWQTRANAALRSALRLD